MSGMVDVDVNCEGQGIKMTFIDNAMLKEAMIAHKDAMIESVRISLF